MAGMTAKQSETQFNLYRAYPPSTIVSIYIAILKSFELVRHGSERSDRDSVGLL